MRGLIILFVALYSLNTNAKGIWATCYKEFTQCFLKNDRKTLCDDPDVNKIIVGTKPMLVKVYEVTNKYVIADVSGALYGQPPVSVKIPEKNCHPLFGNKKRKKK